MSKKQQILNIFAEIIGKTIKEHASKEGWPLDVTSEFFKAYINLAVEKFSEKIDAEYIAQFAKSGAKAYRAEIDCDEFRDKVVQTMDIWVQNVWGKA